MGKYKRAKPKEKKEKRFVSVDMILQFIHKNMENFELMPATTIQIEKRDIEWGDEWNNGTGYEFLIFFSDKTAYLVGQTSIVEDDEDWAQAESYQSAHCSDYYQERQVTTLEVLEKLENLVA